MSSPRDRDPSGDPFEDRPDDGSTWREPTHLGGAPAGPGGDETATSGSANSASKRGLLPPVLACCASAGGGTPSPSCRGCF